MIPSQSSALSAEAQGYTPGRTAPAYIATELAN